MKINYGYVGACTILGVGVGMVFGNVGAYTLIGMGVGMLVGALKK